MRTTGIAPQNAGHTEEYSGLLDNDLFDNRMQEMIDLNRSLENATPAPANWTQEQVAALERYQNRMLSFSSLAYDKFYGSDNQGNLVLLVPSPEGLRAGVNGPIRVTEIDIDKQKDIGMYIPPQEPRIGDEIWSEALVRHLNQMQNGAPHPFYTTIVEGELPIKPIATTRGWVDPSTEQLIPRNHDLVSPELEKMYKN